MFWFRIGHGTYASPLGCLLVLFIQVSLIVGSFFWPLALPGWWKLTELAWLPIATLISGYFRSLKGI